MLRVEAGDPSFGILQDVPVSGPAGDLVVRKYPPSNVEDHSIGIRSADYGGQARDTIPYLDPCGCGWSFWGPQSSQNPENAKWWELVWKPYL